MTKPLIHARSSGMARMLLSQMLSFFLACLCVDNVVFAADWQLGPSLSQPYAYSLSGSLPDGRVVVTSGAYTNESAILSADGTSWSLTGASNSVRTFGASSTLSDGRILIAGGNNGLNSNATARSSTEIWSDTSGVFTSAGSMSTERQAFSLTAIPGVGAIAIGGSAALASGSGKSSAELFSLSNSSWSSAASMKHGRLGHSATLLTDCRVLIVGDNPTAEIFNYKKNSFSDGGTERASGASQQRSYHTATLLPDGKVLIAGGVTAANTKLASAVIYDTTSNTFSSAGNMSVARSQANAVLLRDGKVLIIGGSTPSENATKATDIYDPISNTWSVGPNLLYGVNGSNVERLSDGRVIVIGGTNEVTPDVTQIFTPDTSSTINQPSIDCSNLSGGGGTKLKFAIKSLTHVGAGVLSATVTTPRAGKLTATALYGKNNKYAKTSLKVSSSTSVVLTLNPTKKALEKLNQGKQFKTVLTVTFKVRKKAPVSKTKSIKLNK